MRVLGLDLGEKRIGVAVSDATGLIARGAGYIAHTDTAADIAAIIALMEEHKAERIVVGLPLSMDGKQRDQATAVLGFVSALKEKMSLPIETFDERLTTRYSERLLCAADVSRKKRKKIIDSLAATVILQDYLDAQRSKDNAVQTDGTK